jgi:DNA-binding response OmpR family regulator
MKRVLLIEDDVILRENTAELLELSNFDVITASNGKIGIDTAKQFLPDIVVCDIMMPEVDGYGVLQALFKDMNTRHIPFIFLSAKTERKDVRKGMNLGADDYITKPFTEDELISAIDSRLAKVAILNDEREQQKNIINNREGELHTLSDLKNFFDDNGQQFTFKKGDVIYQENQNSNFIYLVIKGAVKCYKFDEQGKELTTALHNDDDLFGYTSFIQNIPYQETAIAIKSLELVGISKDQFKDVLNNNHKVTLALIQLLTDDLKNIKDQLLQMAYSSVNKKTANTILKFAEKLNRESNEPIKISRSDLASTAGIATESLIRTLSNFRKAGIIDIEGRTIKILNLQKLKDIQ